jgi:AbrB family looped-hinge helix DNA binding protein
MPVFSSSVSPKGQITIPAQVREQFGIRPGDIVHFEVIADTITVIPSLSKLRTGYRSVPPLSLPKTQDEIDTIVRDERAERYAAQRGSSNHNDSRNQ